MILWDKDQPDDPENRLDEELGLDNPTTLDVGTPESKCVRFNGDLDSKAQNYNKVDPNENFGQLLSPFDVFLIFSFFAYLFNLVSVLKQRNKEQAQDSQNGHRQVTPNTILAVDIACSPLAMPLFGLINASIIVNDFVCVYVQDPFIL